MSYNYIFFDLDGTLTDPEHGLLESFAYGLGKMGIKWNNKKELGRFIGPPLYTEWQEVYGFTPEESSRALDFFTEYYQVYGWWDNTVYDGVPEMLAALKASGKKIILATSKPEYFARKILKLFDLEQYFDFIAGAIADKIRDKKWEVGTKLLKNGKFWCIVYKKRFEGRWFNGIYYFYAGSRTNRLYKTTY